MIVKGSLQPVFNIELFENILDMKFYSVFTYEESICYGFVFMTFGNKGYYFGFPRSEQSLEFLQGNPCLIFIAASNNL